MVDVVSAEKRSRMMAGIRGKNTRPEKFVRSYLHARGFRFRFTHRSLPFRPDLVLSRYRLVVFIHGCFWHRHEGCRYTTTPATNPQRWEEKFAKNVERDARQLEQAHEAGWRTLVVWECGIRHEPERMEELSDLIRGEGQSMVWPETPPRAKKDTEAR